MLCGVPGAEGFGVMVGVISGVMEVELIEVDELAVVVLLVGFTLTASAAGVSTVVAAAPCVVDVVVVVMLDVADVAEEDVFLEASGVPLADEVEDVGVLPL